MCIGSDEAKKKSIGENYIQQAVEEAVAKERERIARLISEKSHRHNGELCFSPIKESELWDALKESEK
jgi:hypothetical protein